VRELEVYILWLVSNFFLFLLGKILIFLIGKIKVNGFNTSLLLLKHLSSFERSAVLKGHKPLGASLIYPENSHYKFGTQHRTYHFTTMQEKISYPLFFGLYNSKYCEAIWRLGHQCRSLSPHSLDHLLLEESRIERLPTRTDS
jgi:hypothetical protein